MNREIKFRTWDFIDKKMINFFNPVFVKIENSINFLFSNNFYDLWYSKCQRGSMDSKTFDIMQFTGLKDKQGKEIYEGDIIEFDKKEWGGNDNIHVVSWNNEVGSWSWGGGITSDMEYRKVIGNIYENPELL